MGELPIKVETKRDVVKTNVLPLAADPSISYPHLSQLK
jgi:hypothetical protein